MAAKENLFTFDPTVSLSKNQRLAIVKEAKRGILPANVQIFYCYERKGSDRNRTPNAKDLRVGDRVRVLALTTVAGPYIKVWGASIFHKTTKQESFDKAQLRATAVSRMLLHCRQLTIEPEPVLSRTGDRDDLEAHAILHGIWLQELWRVVNVLLLKHGVRRRLVNQIFMTNPLLAPLPPTVSTKTSVHHNGLIATLETDTKV